MGALSRRRFLRAGLGSAAAIAIQLPRVLDLAKRNYEELAQCPTKAKAYGSR